jgi:hypothetical protein
MQLSDADVSQTVSHHSILIPRSFTMCIINPNPPMNNVNTGCGDDNVHISKADGLLGLLGYNKVDINGHVQYMTNDQLSHTQFNLGAGNDTLVVDKNVTADIHANGGAGNDAMVGGGGNNYFDGGSGKDLLVGRAGVNHMNGGSGDDTFVNTGGLNIDNGGAGNDKFFNLGGVNVDNGGLGNDKFFNLGGLNFDKGGPGWDQFTNLGGINFNQQ